ncbi:MAG: sodium:calcium antiporter, partial [Ruminococcus sp.]|nr:sodium:calcium antiporter [Ruminococcus sp.]
ILYVIGGAVVIVLGGNLSVDSATEIAHQWNISEAIIGLTIVALGTSLPELVTSIIAAKKGSSDMALGNVIGSNIFNVLLILGATALIKPFNVTIESIIDQFILLGISIVLFIASFTKSKISRAEGIMFLLLYVVYAVYIFMRG